MLWLFLHILYASIHLTHQSAFTCNYGHSSKILKPPSALDIACIDREHQNYTCYVTFEYTGGKKTWDYGCLTKGIKKQCDVNVNSGCSKSRMCCCRTPSCNNSTFAEICGELGSSGNVIKLNCVVSVLLLMGVVVFLV